MDITVNNNVERQRYEARDGTTLAGFAAYAVTSELIVFTHTEVDSAYEGHGVGSALARAGLDDARSRALKVMPICPFIDGWISRHPAYNDLRFNAPASRVID